ncbi:MAG: asparagine synthase-related protein, partial [Leadbetterella sp.]
SRGLSGILTFIRNISFLSYFGISKRTKSARRTPEYIKFEKKEVPELKDILSKESSHYFIYKDYLHKKLNIKYITPFLDRDVLAYCMGKSFEEKLGDGSGKFYYRNEMKDILPEKVRTRIYKTTFDLYNIQATEKLIIDSKSFGFSENLFKFVKRDKLESKIKIFFDLDPKSTEKRFLSNELFRIMCVNIWLIAVERKNLKILK